MTKEQRLDFLIRYHTNLTTQLTANLERGQAHLGSQITKVEAEIESILFPKEPTL